MSLFVQSMKRLYVNSKVDKKKIEALCNEGKITEEEKLYILDVK